MEPGKYSNRKASRWVRRCFFHVFSLCSQSLTPFRTALMHLNMCALTSSNRFFSLVSSLSFSCCTRSLLSWLNCIRLFFSVSSPLCMPSFNSSHLRLNPRTSLFDQLLTAPCSSDLLSSFWAARLPILDLPSTMSLSSPICSSRSWLSVTLSTKSEISLYFSSISSPLLMLSALRRCVSLR